MQPLVSFLPYGQMILTVILMGGIILQQRGAGLGGAFGGDSGFGYNSRRGGEKILFQISIAIAILFVFSTLLSLIVR